MKKVEAKRFLRGICTEYGVKVMFRSQFENNLEGFCDLDKKKNKIYINSNLSVKIMASAVFHEIGHLYCLNHGIWQSFHEQDPTSSKLIFKVENWIDWWAKKEWDAQGMRKIFGHYSFSYLKANKKQTTEWIKKYYDCEL